MSHENTTKGQITQIFLSILEIKIAEVADKANYKEELKDLLKFQHIDDIERFRACIDLLEDTEYAIINAFQFQLGDLRKRADDGEMYLRLYGILNAVYLQTNAYIVLCNLLNYNERDKLQTVLKKLRIYEFRSIAGAHTIDHLHNNPTKNRKRTSFKVLQASLNNRCGNNIIAIDESGRVLRFNLLNLLSEYELITRELLINIVTHTIGSLINSKETKVNLSKHLNTLKTNLPDYKKLDRNASYYDEILKEKTTEKE